MTSSTSLASRPAHLLRFDRVQRGAHWATAVLFGVLLATAIPLYFGSFFGVVWPRHVVALTHLWAGLALGVPVVVSLLGPWGARMRADVRRCTRWTYEEVRWLRSRGRTRLSADKFNPGQKLNTVVTGAAIAVMLATGAMLQWFRFFAPSWRTGATFVHDVGAFGFSALVAGHVVMALQHRDALGAMVRGWVSTRWAERVAPAWLEEESAPPGA